MTDQTRSDDTPPTEPATNTDAPLPEQPKDLTDLDAMLKHCEELGDAYDAAAEDADRLEEQASNARARKDEAHDALHAANSAMINALTAREGARAKSEAPPKDEKAGASKRPPKG